ncbi:MAG: hypothetical protein HY381_01675, partial [Candidatus Chisholmbacteria bacterium]|nr:hypothetical protein [Candidatus Chisholmbacteria bacterium]
MFASAKIFALKDLLSLIDIIKTNPQAAKQALATNDFSAFPDPDFSAKLDWLFLHFEHNLDQDEWLQTQTLPPSPTAYKHLLLSYPDHLKATLQATLDASLKLPPNDRLISAPHEAYLRLHAARFGLSELQTRQFIHQQKLAAAAQAVHQLADQGVTTPDATQIKNHLQAHINHTNTHTASLQRAVSHHDTRLTDQLHHLLQPIISSHPSIPASEASKVSQELAQLSYQALKPYVPLVSSPQDLAVILKDKILTTERIHSLPTLESFGFTPGEFTAAIDSASRTLFRRYLKAAQQNLRLLQMYGESDYHSVTTTTPPPQVPLKPQVRHQFLAQGYPGETLVNAANPHALENAIVHAPKTLLNIATSPIRLVLG